MYVSGAPLKGKNRSFKSVILHKPLDFSIRQFQYLPCCVEYVPFIFMCSH